MLQIEPAPPAWQDDDVAALMADTPVPWADSWADSWAEGDLQEPSPFAGMGHLGELTGQQVTAEDQQQVSDLRKGCMLDRLSFPAVQRPDAQLQAACGWLFAALLPADAVHWLVQAPQLAVSASWYTWESLQAA